MLTEVRKIDTPTAEARGILGSLTRLAVAGITTNHSSGQISPSV